MSDAEDLLTPLFESGRVNAAVSWVIIAVYVLVLVESLLSRDVAWSLFTAIVIGIILLPASSRRSPLVMLPWEVLLLGSFPIIVRAVEVSAITNTFATYLSIATLALIVTVEVHVLSQVRVTHWFAIGFVGLGTLAVAGAWAVVRWNMDLLLGTSLLTTNEALMVEFLWVLGAGLVAGVLFDLYFRHRTRRLRRTLRRVIRI